MPDRRVLVILFFAVAGAVFGSAQVPVLASAPRASRGRQQTAARYDINVRTASARGRRHHRRRPKSTKRTRKASKIHSVLSTARYTTLIWSDEFSGPAGTPPSNSKWIHDVGDYGAAADEEETYTDSTANAALDGQGHLAIVALPQSPTGPPGQVRSYSSARLETQGLFSVKYGLIEARMKIPAGAGLWPAFWMLGDDITTVGWPACGEIDVMETIGQNPFTVYGTIHGPSGSTAYESSHTDASATALATGFHTYGVSWSPNSITWLLDGTPYATVTSADLAPGQTWVFNQPFHLVLDLAVGGTWAGAPNASTDFPATLLVDWVRVYH
jgi:beta-glucanase (GH16 family)